MFIEAVSLVAESGSLTHKVHTQEHAADINWTQDMLYLLHSSRKQLSHPRYLAIAPTLSMLIIYLTFSAR